MSTPYNQLETDMAERVKSNPKLTRVLTKKPQAPRRPHSHHSHQTIQRNSSKTNVFNSVTIPSYTNMNNTTTQIKNFKTNCNTIHEMVLKQEIVNGEPVYLCVYHVSRINYLLQVFGCGIYHSTVHLYDTEYSFGYCENKRRSGIYPCAKQNKKFIFKGKVFLIKEEKILLGYTLIQQEDLFLLIDLIGEFWQTGNYHPFEKNCNHFTYLFIRLLLKQTDYPSYVNRFVKTFYLFDCIYSKIIRIMEDTPSSIPSHTRGTTGTINYSNNLTSDNLSKLKNTSNLNVKNNQSNDVEILKLNDNCNFVSIKLQKDSFEEEEFKDLQEIKKNLKTLVKLNVIEDNLCRSIMHFFVEILNNKYMLSLNIISESVKKLRIATAISQKHFKNGIDFIYTDLEKCIILNKVIEESLLFLKKIIDKINADDVKEFLAKEQNDINVLLISMNLKIYEKVHDHRVFIDHCNKIFKEMKDGIFLTDENKNLSISKSEINPNKSKLDNSSIVFSRKFKDNKNSDGSHILY